MYIDMYIYIYTRPGLLKVYTAHKQYGQQRRFRQGMTGDENENDDDSDDDNPNDNSSLMRMRRLCVILRADWMQAQKSAHGLPTA